MFVLLAVVQTWPLASDPAHLARTDPGDGALNIWAVGWVAHQLPRHPLSLFDANIFYPERLTLAYSEAMIVQGVMAMPIVALGGTAVLANNLVLLAGFALTGWAFCLLVTRWTGSWSAGLVAGSLAAFNAHVLVRLPHLQTLHPEFYALILFALDRVVRSARARNAVWLGVGFALQGLTSIYHLVFATWTLIFAAAARIGDAVRTGVGKVAARYAMAVAIGAAILSPYLWGYWRLHELTGWTRGADDQWPASWADYLSTGARLHYTWWSQPYTQQAASYTFPGIVALALVGAAWGSRDNRRDPRFRMAAIVAAGCAALSFSPLWPFYPALNRAIPLFQAVRVPAHLGQVVLLMVAVMAGYGVAALQRWWDSPRRWPAAAVVLVLLVNGEALRAPVGWTVFPGIPSPYDLLADARGAVVAELPFPAGRQWFVNTPYMVNATRHFQKMLNGYSGFRPPSYEASFAATRGFPSDASLIALHERGVTHIVLHKQAFIAEAGPERFAAISGVRSLVPLGDDGEVFVYRLENP